MLVADINYTLHNKVEGVYWNRHGCPSVCPWTQFYPELFSYSFACTALKFIHNVCVHMKLCMCNFHDNTIIGCGIIFTWTCKFYWIIVVQRNNPTVLHVLNSKLHTMSLVAYSSACAIFITIVSLVAELYPLELVNFTKALLTRALLLHFCKYCSEIYTMFVCIWSCAYTIFMMQLSLVSKLSPLHLVILTELL